MGFYAPLNKLRARGAVGGARYVHRLRPTGPRPTARGGAKSDEHTPPPGGGGRWNSARWTASPMAYVIVITASVFVSPGSTGALDGCTVL
jgi:hypothetical protein